MQALVLGTAQWGDAYGITNTRGRLSDAEVAAIATAALDRGIDFADTASGYGDAEKRLASWSQSFKVTTKVKAGDTKPIIDQVSTSLRSLGAPQIHGCLIHDWSVLSDSEAEFALKQLNNLKSEGLVERIGVSGYEPLDLLKAIQTGVAIDYAQIPANVLDRRFELSPYTNELRMAGCRFQIRSVFLQGLLLSITDSIDASHKSDLHAFHARCAEQNLTPLLVALKHVQRLQWADQVVVGATSAIELKEICDVWESESHVNLDEFAESNDLRLIDPRNWSTT